MPTTRPPPEAEAARRPSDGRGRPLRCAGAFSPPEDGPAIEARPWHRRAVMAMLVMSQAARMNVASRRHHGWAAQERRAAANPGRARSMRSTTLFRGRRIDPQWRPAISLRLRDCRLPHCSPRRREVRGLGKITNYPTRHRRPRSRRRRPTSRRRPTNRRHLKTTHRPTSLARPMRPESASRPRKWFRKSLGN
jgi:hypothetical protein